MLIGIGQYINAKNLPYEIKVANLESGFYSLLAFDLIYFSYFYVLRYYLFYVGRFTCYEQ